MSDDTSIRGLIVGLVDPPAWSKPLPAIPPAQPIGAQAGRGTPTPAAVASGGGGVNLQLGGPLTLTSTDGIFVLAFTQTITLTLNGVAYKLPVVG